MHTVEFTLVLLACVIASAVLAQVVRQLSLPLVQIVAGVVVACIVPTVYGVDIPAELFLVLFIAPLLFDEARSINRRALWENKGAIVSLAVGLVLLTVLVVGFVLHWFVPSIPLAAAFACAAALAPTDAAAVGALGSRVGLKPRQSTLLAGESLINDASGVVAFQFAIAAALTGSFSAADAAVSFARLFFGGIAMGAVLGMQLPRALSPAFADHFSLPFLLGLVALATVLVVVCRFLWVLVMELVHRDRGTPVLRDALILTIAGPKGAVTLSIIFIIPPTLADGSAFPGRDLLIFLTASVILCTLLLADGLLPRLAPRRREDGEASATELCRGTIKVLEGALRELRPCCRMMTIRSWSWRCVRPSLPIDCG